VLLLLLLLDAKLPFPNCRSLTPVTPAHSTSAKTAFYPFLMYIEAQIASRGFYYYYARRRVNRERNERTSEHYGKFLNAALRAQVSLTCVLLKGEADVCACCFLLSQLTARLFCTLRATQLTTQVMP
jgi:hypothetical protein